MELLLLLPVVFLLGIISSYIDIKDHIIKNSLVFGCIAYGVLVHFFFSAELYLYLINFIISLAVGFGFYAFRVWGAGDAKLFLAFVALLPLELYGKSIIPYFSSSALFFNIFLISFLFIFFLSFRKQHIADTVSYLYSLAFFKELLATFVGILCFSWIMKSFIGGTLVYLSAFLFYLLLSHIANRWIQYGVFLVSFLVGLGLGKIIISPAIGYIFLFALPFTFIRKSFKKLVQSMGPLSMDAKYLKEGMMIDRIEGVLTETGGISFDKELSKKDVQRLQPHLQGKKVYIHDLIPLAPSLFISVIITLLIKTDIITWFLGKIL